MTDSSRTDGSGPSPNVLRRAGFALVLSLAMGTGTFPGFAFGVLGPDLIAEFDLTRTELGLLTTVFFAVGGFGSITAGRVVDAFGARRTMMAAFAAVAASLLAMSVAGGFGWLLIAAAAGGVSLAAGNPTTNKSVSEHVPAGRRGLTMGVKQAGVQIGAVLAGSLVAPLAAEFGWRQALVISALVPAAGVLLALLFVPADPHVDASTRNGPKRALPPSVRHLAVYAFLMGAGVGAFNAYLPLYGVEELGLTTTRAGAIAATVGFVGVVSRIAWGWTSEHLPSFHLPLAVMAGGATVAVALLLAAPALGVTSLFVGGMLFGATAVTWNSVGMLAVVAGVDSADAGRASGVVLFGFYTGFVPSPVVFGTLVDLTGDYRAAWGLLLAVFAVAAWWIRDDASQRRRVSVASA
jgi:nitrate/nitrite transporter NarK